MRLYALLLLFLGSLHGVSAQVPVLIEEEEDSGETEWTLLPNYMEDIYWSGTAPICVGGCRGKHQELKRDRCGDSECCWFGFKSLCRVSCGRPDVDYNGWVRGGSDWLAGSVVSYACRPGFQLVGDPVRSCQSNGLWTPKPSCLRMCQRGSVDINEKELSGTCSSTCADKSYFGPPKQGCSGIDGCRKKETGWKRFFSRCAPCVCTCSVPCALG